MDNLFNTPSYHYNIRIIDKVVMIPTTEIAELFGMRHSNVMRACENARKHLSEPDKELHNARFSMSGKFNPGYYVSRTVFNIVTKRANNINLKNAIDAYMRVLLESEETEPANRPESLPVNTPVKVAEPKPVADVEKLFARIDELERKLLRLSAIEEKLDFIISNGIRTADKPAPFTPPTQQIKVSNEPISVGELAKVLNQTGINIGEMRLFQWLREKEYLCAYGSEYNLPRQKFIEQGLFTIKTSRVQLPTGQVMEKNTTKVTAKGQEYFINKFVYQSSQSR